MAGGRHRLSRELILDTVLAMADESGLERVSMRRVASRLGVEAMSLYNHVSNKADILDGLVERLVLEIRVESHEGEPWQEALRRLAAEYRSLANAHRMTFTLLATRPLSTAASMKHVEPLFTLLGRAGFSVPDRVLALTTYFTFLNGYLLAEVGTVPGHADVPEPRALSALLAAAGEGTVAADLQGLPAESVGLAANFDRAVDLVIGGIETLRR